MFLFLFYPPGVTAMEAVGVAFVILFAVVRAVSQRRDRRARSTVARALRGVSSSDARFARYPNWRGR